VIEKEGALVARMRHERQVLAVAFSHDAVKIWEFK
jgi:hypothetical protein